ncbi:MAG TPA: hypothetical protein VLJ57_09055 [Burkholderiaceae bacterium]|nr:hypothetical protein [Burkholderiaceae bacterium]
MTSPSQIPDRAFSRYLAIFAALVFGSMAAILFLNYSLDPFLTHQWETPHVQRLQPVGEKLAPWGKTFAVHKYQPQVLYVGNSRTHWALPADPKFFNAKRVFNGGIAGGSLADAISLLRHARVASRLDTVVWGVDYWEFSLDGGHPDFTPELVASDTSYWLRRTVLDLKRALSFDMTVASLDLLAGRTEAVCRSSLAFHGQRDEACIVRNMIDRGGVSKVLFKDVLAVKGVNNKAMPAMPAFRGAIGELCQAGIRVLIYVNPLHAITLENFYRRGFGGELDAWKRQLVRVASEAQEQGCDIGLFDFSGFNSVTSETVPDVSGRASMRNYWEGSHYRTVVGRQILARMTKVEEDTVPIDFGTRLVPGNLEDHLGRIRIDRERYRREHGQELDLLEKWFGPNKQEP